jgi:hypothetical protein
MADENLKVMATATSKRPGRQRWTTLTLYQDQGEAWVAEIIGGTEIAGEEHRVRRERFPALLAALDWNAFDPRSELFQELRRKAMAALEAQLRGDYEINWGTKAVRLKEPVQDVGLYTRDRVIAHLREIVEAASASDELRLKRAIYNAEDFLQGLDRAAG